LVPVKKGKRLELKLSKVVYTKFAIALEQIAKFEAGSLRNQIIASDFLLDDIIEQLAETEIYEQN
jgi:hypothetical protein